MSLKRDKQIINFLKWIRSYPGWWYLICTPGDEHMTISMMKKLIENLAEKGFYEIIFVLLMVHRNADFMKNVPEIILLEMIISNLNGEVKGKEQFVRDLTDLLT